MIVDSQFSYNEGRAGGQPYLHKEQKWSQIMFHPLFVQVSLLFKYYLHLLAQANRPLLQD